MFSAAVCFLLSGHGVAQQLFPDGAGWYQPHPQGDIYVTAGRGAHWRDAIPDIPKSYYLDSIFFLNSSTGWLAMVGPRDPQHPHSDEMGGTEFALKIAFTTNSGAAWSIWDVRLVNASFPYAEIGGRASLWFVDSEHGWLNLGCGGNTAFPCGNLLAKKDGGHTWEFLPHGESGQVSFVSAARGWIVGGPGDQHVYGTQDGGQSWQDVSPEAPSDFGLVVSPVFLPVVIEDRGDVFLPAIFTTERGSTFVLFSAVDNGREWKPYIRTPIHRGNWLEFSVLGKDLLTAEISDQSLTLTTITPSGTSSSRHGQVPWSPWPAGFANVERFSMTDRDHGWATVWFDGGTGPKLFATANGGLSWADVTP